MLNYKLTIVLVTLIISNLAQADLTSGLVAYYLFNGNDAKEFIQ